jgi:hypothetical protein
MAIFDKSASMLSKILVFTVIIIFILSIICVDFVANNNKKVETLDNKVSTNIRDFQNINSNITKLFNFDTNQICNGKQCIDIHSLIIQNEEAAVPGNTPYDFKQLLPTGGKVLSSLTSNSLGTIYINTYVSKNSEHYILQDIIGVSSRGTRRSTVQIGKLTSTNKGDWT